MRGLLLSLLICGASFDALGDSIQQLRDELQQQNYARAAITGLGLLRRQPDDLETLFLTARALHENGQQEAAIRQYQHMLEIDPSLPEPLNNLAAIYQQQGDHDKAIELLTASINTHPAYATAWQNLGKLYRGLASDAYRRALSEQDDVRPSVDRLQLTALTRLHDMPDPISDVAQEISPAPGAASPTVVAEPEVVVQAPPPETTQPEPVRSTSLPAQTVAQESAQAPVAPVPESKPEPEPEPVAVATTPEHHQPEPQPTPPVVSAEPSAPAQDLPGDEQLQQAVEKWATAWDRKDFDSYVDAYTSDYKGRKGSHAAWVKFRRGRILRPGDIRVKLSNIRVHSRAATRAVVDFHQAYSSPNYSDKVAKRVVLILENGAWKIARESTLAVL